MPSLNNGTLKTYHKIMKFLPTTLLRIYYFEQGTTLDKVFLRTQDYYHNGLK